MVLRVEGDGVRGPVRPRRGGMIAHGPAAPGRRPRRSHAPTSARSATREEDPARVAIRPTPGRSLVTRRALVDIVRTATLGSYGVAGLAGDPLSRLAARLGFADPGIAIRLDDGIEIELDLTIALGVPVAEVARQVDSAVRYAVHRALAQDVRRLVIHVDGLRVQPSGTAPSLPAEPHAIRPRDLADSGTDVA